MPLASVYGTVEAALPDVAPGDTKTATPIVRMTVVASSHQVERTEAQLRPLRAEHRVIVRFPATGVRDRAVVAVAACITGSPARSLRIPGCHAWPA